MAVLDWPTVGSTPVDEFNTSHFITTAFPVLFPTGRADLHSPLRTHFITPKDYFRHLLHYKDGRFANDPRFRFLAFNMVMRWEALRAGSMYVRRNEDLQGKTVADLRDMVAARPALTREIMFFGSKLRGTRQYWGARMGELLAMVDDVELGLPTIFMTLSAADLHWPDLYRLLLSQRNPAADHDVEAMLLRVEEEMNALTEEMRRDLVADQPFVPCTFFVKRVEFFLDHVVKAVLDVKEIWFRYEWQFRGSPHVHALIWLRGAPDVRQLKDMGPEQLQQSVAYYDNLVSTWNVGLGLPPADTNPCRRRLSDIPAEQREEFLGQLLNRVQRHTRCSPGYCLRLNKRTQQMECRFGFPVDLRDSSELLANLKGELDFLSRRNDPLINSYNRRVIMLWLGNIDVQVISSPQRCANYLAKYASKPEKKSRTMHELFEDAVNGLDGDDSAKRAIQRRLVQSVSDRDYSAQEILHLATGQKLYHSSRSFVKLNLRRSDWVAVGRRPAQEAADNDQDIDDPDVPEEPLADDLAEEGGDVAVADDEVAGESILDRYPKRPAHLQDVSLWSLARNYYHISRPTPRWKSRRKFAVVCVYPRLHLTDNPERDEAYYRQQVLLHVPWRTEEQARGDHATWHEAYSAFRELNPHPATGPALPEPEEDELEDPEDAEEEVLDEWMTVACQHPNQPVQRVELGRREVDLAHDWAAAGDVYPHPTILSRFLENAKAQFVEEDLAVEEPAVHFTPEQHAVLAILDMQLDAELNPGGPEPPRRVIVQGKAGCGKSTLIQAMQSRIVGKFGNRAVLLLAPTGAAAINIKGRTIHSGLNIPPKVHVLDPLGAEQLREFRGDMEDVRFLIVDEYSMISLSLLGMMERRCTEAQPTRRGCFANLNVYLIGDLAQLPPVAAKPLYDTRASTDMEENGAMAFANFQHAVVLSVSQRQTDTTMRDALDEVASGTCSIGAYQLMSRRFSTNVPNHEQLLFKDAPHVFTKRTPAQEHNLEKLLELDQPVARIPATNNNATAARACADDACGLQSVLYLAVGARVILKANLWTKQGLVNNAAGTVTGIVYAEGRSPPDHLPAAVMVRFDRYQGPCVDYDDSFPVTPQFRSWRSGDVACSREQIPLILGWGVTVHFVQGLTADRVVVDIGDREFSPGLAYVGLSRTKTWEGLLIHPPFLFRRLSNLGRSKVFKRKVAAIRRITRLANHTSITLNSES